MQLSGFLQLLLSGISSGSIYALVAIGFTIVYNCTGIVNFAQGEFVMLGAMIAGLLVGGGMSLPLACIIAVLATALIGSVVGSALLKPLRTGSQITMIIITVGASILIRGAVLLRPDKEPVSLPFFSKGAEEGIDRTFSLFGAVIDFQSLWVIATMLVLIVLLFAFYKYTMMGRAMRACASCKPGAKTVGININRMTMLSFALAAAVGAVAGAVVAPITTAQYDIGTMLGLKGFCAAILGGLGNFTGGIVAGLMLGVLESFGAGSDYGAYKDAIAFVVMLLVLFVRPQGIFGGKKAR